LERTVAIKKVLGGFEAEELLRFQREARLLAKLTHPGIAVVHEVVTDGPGAPYLVMDFVPGSSLEALCRGEGLDPARAARIVRGVAEIVAHAHAAGVVHRDLKPQNVMVTPEERPVVLDFGLARQLEGEGEPLTRTGDFLGTPAYMAPEQVQGARDVGPTADVYALGAILFECLAGRPPFEKPNVLEVLVAVEKEEPPPPSSLSPSVPAGLEAIALKCLRKAPEDRYPSAADLSNALTGWLSRGDLRKRKRSSSALLFPAAVLVLLTTFVGWWTWRESGTPKPSRSVPTASEPTGPPTSPWPLEPGERPVLPGAKLSLEPSEDRKFDSGG
jgi:serine/threonine-protein kinase